MSSVVVIIAVLTAAFLVLEITYNSILNKLHATSVVRKYLWKHHGTLGKIAVIIDWTLSITLIIGYIFLVVFAIKEVNSIP